MQDTDVTSLSDSLPYRVTLVADGLLKISRRFRHAVDRSHSVRLPFRSAARKCSRLRATSDLTRLKAPLLTNSASYSCVQNNCFIEQTLIELDALTPTGSNSILDIASSDALLCGQSPGSQIEGITQKLTWNEITYMFDMSMFLVTQLKVNLVGAVKSSGSGEKYCRKVQDEKFIANLLHLLLRLQTILFFILVYKTKNEVEQGPVPLRNVTDVQLEEQSVCDKEWPNGQRPLSTTWPWNVRPSLIVLWGVCWMFYPPRSGHGRRAPARTTAASGPSTLAFSQDWQQNLPPVDPGFSHAIQGTTLAESYATLGGATSWQSHQVSPDEAAVLQWTETLEPVEQLLGNPPIPGNSDPPFQSSLTTHVTPSATTYYGSSEGVTGGLETTWPYPAGNQYLQPGPDRPTPYQANVWTSQLQDTRRTPQVFFPLPISFGEFAQFQPSPLSAFQYSQPSSSYRHQLQPSSAGSLNYRMGEMGYPLSPRSERQPSVSASVVSAGSAVLSTDHSSPASDTSRRPRPQKRDRTPPRNAQGQIYCDQPDCKDKNITFRRPCEWNKHMDKHERPWKCYEPGCETSLGFTYSGGLLRHQREVHKMHLAARRPLYCPFPNCNRSSGTGFTRKENLEEHKRRRHLADLTCSPPVITSSSPTSTTQSLHSESMPPPSGRKRRRQDPKTEPPEGDDDEQDDEDDDEEEHSSTRSSATSDSQRLVQRLTEEIARRDAVIKHQNVEIARMRQTMRMQATRQVPAATTA